MKNYRIYGKPPYNVVVIHGGPGAPGSMSSVANELSTRFGVLEPFQTEETINGQIEELNNILNRAGNIPVTLIGHSWGAWLSYMFTARNQNYVKKLILVGSGPFEQKYVPTMNDIRASRLTNPEKTRLEEIQDALFAENCKNKKEIFKEYGKIMSKVDSYDPINFKQEIIKFQPKIYNSIMKKAKKLRKSGELLDSGRYIGCPVVAIHGDYDPHPYEGVKEPLSGIIKYFKFILLEECGHCPWKENNKKDQFFEVLRKEIIQ